MKKNISKKIKKELYYSPFVKLLSDKTFCKIHYRVSCKNKLNLDNPIRFNEKLQWLKLNYRKDIFTKMVDKYEVKELVKQSLGDDHVIESLGVWNSFDEIDFDGLPNKFVLKCTHDSGGIVICRDKSTFDIKEAKKKLNKSLKRNYYYLGREWPYKNVAPRILAEKYMENPNNENLDVYKVLTFNGEPRIIQTIQNDKTPNETIDYFDCEWNLLDLRQDYPNSNEPLKKPETLDQMINYARLLSNGFPFLRVDFYDINGKVYFSEFTFYSDNGFAAFHPEEWDEKLGKWIDLSIAKNN